jgi:hypothetical protein
MVHLIVEFVLSMYFIKSESAVNGGITVWTKVSSTVSRTILKTNNTKTK